MQHGQQRGHKWLEICTKIAVLLYTMQLGTRKHLKKGEKSNSDGLPQCFHEPKGMMALPHTGCIHFAISKNLLCYQNYFSSSTTAVKQPEREEPCFAPAPPGNCKQIIQSQQGVHKPLLSTKMSTANSWMHNCLSLLTSTCFWGIPTSMTRKKMTLPPIF